MPRLPRFLAIDASHQIAQRQIQDIAVADLLVCGQRLVEC